MNASLNNEIEIRNFWMVTVSQNFCMVTVSQNFCMVTVSQNFCMVTVSQNFWMVTVSQNFWMVTVSQNFWMVTVSQKNCESHYFLFVTILKIVKTIIKYFCISNCLVNCLQTQSVCVQVDIVCFGRYEIPNRKVINVFRRVMTLRT